MIADLKPYPEYKESGLPWLGRVPRHWEVKRLKNWVAINASTLSEDTPGDYEFEYLDIGSVGTGRLTKSLNRLRFASAPSRARRLLRPGDTIVSTVRTYLKAVLTVGGISEPLIASTGFAVLTPRVDAVPRCLGYLAQSEYFTNYVTSESVGIAYLAISETKLANIPITFAPPEEQASIVRFLDWANGRLERAIRAKRKVIALLNEQKQAIIHRAVTRGLDPSVPLKPSGIPWLGDIPQHWSLKRFKFLATINSGQVDPRKADFRDLVLIAPNHIEGGSGRLLNQETANEQGVDSGKYFVNRGQIVYSKIRPNLRKATIAPCDCLCSADMYPIAPTTEELSTDYLLLLLLSQPFTKFAVDTSMRVAMPKVNREALANCVMWYPGAQEQSQILGFIGRESAPLTTAISRLEREIELLREYRTRLVADVVTGKLEVREAAARLPDEAPPDITEDDIDLSNETEPADEEAIA